VQAVSDHKDKRGWRYVAETVGKGVSVRQCVTKWQNMKTVQQKGLKQAVTKWTEKDVITQSLCIFYIILICIILYTDYLFVQNKSLIDAVQRQTDQGVERISWSEVSRTVGRSSIDCRNRHIMLRCKELNREPFTAAEDELIRERVAKWTVEKRGRGLWMSLQEEMHRPQDLIHRRAEKLQQKGTLSDNV